MNAAQQLVAKLRHLATRASLIASPRPAALALRREFAVGGRQRAAKLAQHAQRESVDVVTVRDVRYDSRPETMLDIHWPSSVDGTSESLPTMVWVHGGGWVGGSRDEARDYLRMIAARGFTTVGIGYSLAPGSTYPTPVRQVMAALGFLSSAERADRYPIDTQRLVVAGDSAGAHIAAQVATIVTNPDYAQLVQIAPSVAPDDVRGVALFCGPYDLVAISEIEPMRTFFTTIVRAYSGTRRFRDDPHFATAAVVRHVTAFFPPAFVSAGNADPLVAHSRALVDALRLHGVAVEALLYPPDHTPALEHEYQFDLDLPEARDAFDRLVAFAKAASDRER